MKPSDPPLPLGVAYVKEVARQDRGLEQILLREIPTPSTAETQREQAFTCLNTAMRWAAVALASIGIDDTDVSPIADSEQAFQRGQHLNDQVWKPYLLPGRHDNVALIVDSVKNACYGVADLGPIPGGRFKSDRTRIDTPPPESLDDVGRCCGQALWRLGMIGLADVVSETKAAFATGIGLI